VFGHAEAAAGSRSEAEFLILASEGVDVEGAGVLRAGGFFLEGVFLEGVLRGCG